MLPSVVVLLYFGTNHINDCPIQPFISVFMIVTGWSNLVNAMLFMTAFITANYMKRSSDPSPYTRYLLIGSLIGQLILLIFSVGWLVAGQIWVFGVQLKGFQSTDPTQPATYCHSAVFWNGFATIFITYAIWLILILAFARRFIIKRCDAKRKAASAYEEF
jgi:Mn2+/Fe2+ NRAMP family transporter